MYVTSTENELRMKTRTRKPIANQIVIGEFDSIAT